MLNYILFWCFVVSGSLSLSGGGTVTIAISFDSGILFCAHTKYSVSARIHLESTRIFPKQYGSKPGCARSIFLISEPADWTIAALRRCERALSILRPAEYTIARMRATIETSLLETYDKDLDSQRESKPEATMLVALYSPSDQQFSLFRTSATALRELAGYDCQGTAAYLGHLLIRERYRAAQSMDALDLTSVFSIALETLEGVREHHRSCGESAEIIVMYANGCVSDVQRMHQNTQNQREYCLERVAALSA